MIKLFQLEVKGNFFQIFKVSLRIVSALIRVNCILIDLKNPIMFMHFLDIHQRDPLFCHSVDQENLGQETVHRYEKRKVVIVEVDDKLDIPTIFIWRYSLKFHIIKHSFSLETCLMLVGIRLDLSVKESLVYHF